jgi:hypothetical protein
MSADRLAAWCRDVLAGRLLAPPFDAGVAELVGVHRVGPWLHDSLAGSSGYEHSAWAPVLRRMAAQSLAQTALDDRVRREVLGRLRAAGVPAAPLKGSVLGRLVYGAPHLRPSHDLDVWVAPGAWRWAEAALAGAGYLPAARGLGRRIAAMSHEKAFWRGDDLPVELHRNLTQPGRFALAERAVGELCVAWHFDGVATRRLNDAALAAHAVVHAAHHKFAVPLICFVDLALLLRRAPAAEVAALCRAWRAERALWMAGEALAAYLGEPALARAAARPPALARTALGRPRLVSRRPGAVRARWLGFWLITRPRDRLRFAAAYAGRAVLDACAQSSRQLRSNWG